MMFLWYLCMHTCMYIVKIMAKQGIYFEGLLLLKMILLSRIGMAVKYVFFVHKMRQLNIYSSNATLLVLYGSVIQAASGLCTPTSIL
jgi:hypothetical protein